MSDARTFPAIPAYDGVMARDFQDIFMAGRPAVLKGHVAHWSAVARGREGPGAVRDYLKGFDSGAPVTVVEAPASAGGRFFYSDDLSDFNFNTRQAPLAQALDRIIDTMGRADAPVAAVQMLPAASHLPGFAQANPSPLLPPQVGPRLWVAGAMRTQTHNDPDHNIACVVAGRRRFVLFPPDQVGNLYVGPLDKPPPLSLAQIEDPDFERFPRFREALDHAVEATLEAGDALFMPKYWWHHVTSLAPFNLMVNYWWGDHVRGIEAPSMTFRTALLALKDLPPMEKAYWRAMFETYVFGDDGAAHIPPARRGALGRLPPQTREQFRRELLQSLLKP